MKKLHYVAVKHLDLIPFIEKNKIKLKDCQILPLQFTKNGDINAYYILYYKNK